MRSLLIVPMLLLLVSCQAGDLSRTMSVSLSPLAISAELSGYEYKKINGQDYTFIRGQLIVKNAGSVKERMELDYLFLLSDNTISKGANVDSVAYFIPEFEVQPNEMLTKRVYWVFPGRLPPHQLEKIELRYKQKQ